MTVDVRRGALPIVARLRIAAVGAATATRAAPRLARPVPRAAPGPIASPPDSRFARAVTERAMDELSAEIREHSIRCWHWSSAFAAVDGLTVDPELAYAAALLHDLALGTEDDPAYGCFATKSGDLAADLVRDHRDAEDAAVVRDAIAEHFQPVRPPEPHASCLHSAVNLDVVGYRLRDLPAATVVAVEEAHPSAGFARAFADAMAVEARYRPASSAASLWRAGARLPMTLNPLNRAAR